MNVRTLLTSCAVATAALVSLPLATHGAPYSSAESHAGVIRNSTELQLNAMPALPTCAPMAVESGDPGTGPSVIYAKIASGCAFPWHWHTPTEQLMMVTGEARLQMQGGAPQDLRAGGFALLPAHHVHEMRCTSDCTLYISSDAAFDIHYVDAQGNELAPDTALASVQERTVASAK